MSSTSILLVMYMMNDLVHPDGAGGKAYGVTCAKRNVYENTKLAIARARKAGMLVGYVRVGFSHDYRECPPNSPVFSKARDNGMFKLGTWGTEVYSEFAPQEGDADIIKHRVSPFYGTRLFAIVERQWHQAPGAFRRFDQWCGFRCRTGRP